MDKFANWFVDQLNTYSKENRKTMNMCEKTECGNNCNCNDKSENCQSDNNTGVPLFCILEYVCNSEVELWLRDSDNNLCKLVAFTKQEMNDRKWVSNSFAKLYKDDPVCEIESVMNHDTPVIRFTILD